MQISEKYNLQNQLYKNTFQAMFCYHAEYEFLVIWYVIDLLLIAEVHAATNWLSFYGSQNSIFRFFPKFFHVM